MTSQMFGNVGMAFYDSKELVSVEVEKIPAIPSMPGQPALPGYFRVQFSSGAAAFYLLLNRSQLLELCDELDAEASEYLGVTEEVEEK